MRDTRRSVASAAAVAVISVTSLAIAQSDCPQVWSALPGEMTGALPDGWPSVYDMLLDPRADGFSLLLTGDIVSVGGFPSHGLATWNGQYLSPADGSVFVGARLATYEWPDGMEVYAATLSRSTNIVMRWRGGTWTQIAELGRPDPYPTSYPFDLEVLDDGSGAKLYLAGMFSSINGRPISAIARWDRLDWEPVGEPFAGDRRLPNPAVGALARFDDGTGPKIYAGGYFLRIGDLPVTHLARWDGVSWEAVGEPINIVPGSRQALPYIMRFIAFDDGSGPALYMAGSFHRPFSQIMRWNGSQLEGVGDGIPTYSSSSYANVLAHWRLNNQNVLVVGGNIRHPNLNGANLVYWNGSAWNAFPDSLDANPDSRFSSAYAVDELGIPGFYVGGYFDNVGGVPARGVARYGCLRGDLDCSAHVDNFDIDAFVLALTDPDAYAAAYPNCNRLLADTNVDGLVDNLDVDAFIERLIH